MCNGMLQNLLWNPIAILTYQGYGVSLKAWNYFEANRPPRELATASFIFTKVQVISWLEKENCWNSALLFWLFASVIHRPLHLAVTSNFPFNAVCARAQLRPTLYYPTDCSLPDSSVHGLFMARILECVAILSSRESSQPRDRTRVSCIAGGFFTSESLGKQFVITQHNSLSSR